MPYKDPDVRRAKGLKYCKQYRQRHAAELKARRSTPEAKAKHREWARKYQPIWEARRRASGLPVQDIEKRRATWRAYSARWAEANRETLRVKAREWRAANPDKVRASNRVQRLKIDQVAERERNRQRAKAHLEVGRQRKARRRARELGTCTERIDYRLLLQENDGTCGICRKPLDLFGYEFDHIVPLAAGGTHTQDNIQLAHARCNRVKGAQVAA